MEVSDPWLCCVTPIAQRMQTRFASAIMSRHVFNGFHGQAAVCESKLQRERLQALPILVESIDPLLEKLCVCQPVVEKVAADRAESQTRSVLGFGCRKISARRAISFSRRSETISFWPCSL